MAADLIQIRPSDGSFDPHLMFSDATEDISTCGFDGDLLSREGSCVISIDVPLWKSGDRADVGIVWG
jgi:hypothetical protein